MKKILFALTFLILIVSFTAGQRKRVTEVQVTTQMVARQPAAKAYSLDLTKTGKIYTIAKNIDYAKVSVHTAKGDMSIADLVKKFGKNISGPLRIGMTSDIRTRRFGLSRRGGVGGIVGRRLNYDCSDLACACTGDDDCNDLFSTTKCGPIAVCYPDGCFCLRL